MGQTHPSITIRQEFRNDKKRCVTLQHAHNNMFTHVARARCSDACPPAATLVCLTALLMSMQPAPPNPPSTFPTHVDWLMYASMSGSLRPTHTNDVPSHPTARMKHQPSPPALLDGTGLLQMPLQRAESPEAKQDNCIKWEQMRNMRSQQRHYEPSETPRLNPTHKHQRGSDNALLAEPHSPPTRRAHLFTTAPQSETCRTYPKAQFTIPEGSILFVNSYTEGPLLLLFLFFSRSLFFFSFFGPKFQSESSYRKRIIVYSPPPQNEPSGIIK